MKTKLSKYTIVFTEGEEVAELEVNCNTGICEIYRKHIRTGIFK